MSAIDISADSACLICADTGEIIYAKNENEKRSMASTTKIMTGLLALENSTPDEIATVSKNAEMQEGTSLYLRAGEKISIEDLLYGLMLSSGNDTAVVIAEHVSGSIDEFAEKMTEKAIEIGAVNTAFKNPNGLECDGHYTTAYDLALIGAYAMKNEKFREIVATKNKKGSVDGNKILYFTNHNKLLDMYPGSVGIKTGFTKSAGRCLVSAAEKDNILLIAVTLNAPDDWNDHKKMFDFGFEKVSLKTIVKKGQILKSTKIGGEICNFLAERDVTKAGTEESKFEVVLHIPPKITAPIAAGEKIGEAEIFFKNVLIDKFNIISESEIHTAKYDKKVFLLRLKKVIEIFLNTNKP